MARIDFYVSSLERFGAAGMGLGSNAKVLLHFPSGDRVSAQTTAHADLVTMVEEVAPAAVMTALRAGQKRAFPYELKGKPFQIAVEPMGRDAWKIEIQPGEGAAASQPSPPAPAASATSTIVQTPPRRTTPPTAEPAPAREPQREVPREAPKARATNWPREGPEPTNSKNAQGIDKLLAQMTEMGASDLHLGAGNVPFVRHHGEMKPLPGHGVFTEETLLGLLFDIAPPRSRDEFERRNDTDFAYAIPGVARYRGNVFRDRKGVAAVFHGIPFQIHSAAELGLPPAVLDLCALHKGLVLVTGPTGSGKSTTLAALIDHVNATRSEHIITIEDPIEFVHENKKCLVNQREVHTHTESFKDALRAALREDPDIVLVGELRDLETIAIAVETAETGHLVFGTLHTTTAPSTVDRIIDQFPPDRQEQIRQMLAESLRGVIAQTLCKRKGGGRAAAYEILLATGAVSNLIRERKTFQLASLMQTGRGQGMVTLNDSLLELVRKGAVEPREAYAKAVAKSDLKASLAREGIRIDDE